MGCGSSLGIGSKVADRNPQEQANNDNSPLTPEEIRSRIVCSEKSTRLQLTPSLSIEYAFVSQRGYYPDAIDKPNQDSFTIIPSFAGDPSKIFFGIFDGHGATGDLCSIFAKKEVPERLIKLMAKGTPGNFAEIYSAAFTDTNAKLHTSRIDDSLSGTTAITCYMDGDIIHVANVGDSRAVIARNDQPRIVASPLSVDQTPYRTDERERVKRYGARVLTMDQLEGIAPIHENWATAINEEVDEDGDPPRVWSPTGNFPGTAFTRSIGDEIAESLGVFATPEIASLQLTPSDRYIVIASDGVFEFLTNQAVVDIIKAYSDPLEACEKVVTESYRLWLHYELRTDDITIVCIYLDHTASSHDTEANKERLQSQKNNDLITTNMLNDRVAELRPVRRGMSKQKRRDQMKKDMAKMVTEEDLNYKMNDHVILKSKQEMDKIQEITQTNWLFKQLTAQQRNDVYKVMVKVTVNENDVVIRQGDPGDRFYCVQSGDYQILGPLQKIIDNDRAQREAKHNFQIAVSNLREHSPEASSVKNDVARGQLSFKCVAQTSEVGTLTTFETTSKVRLTVRVVSKRQTKANNKIEEVMREAAIHKSMKRPISVATVPVCMGTWTDANGLYMAFNSNMVCDIAGLMLDAETKFSEDVVRQYAAQLLIGLETLHDVGIVYRNMNPENIMLDDNGYVQLHDFRYATIWICLIDDLRTYTLCGTAEYTAPEMVSAQGHSFGVDIWGLGILIYEMLYGITPFACDDLENDKDVVLAVYSKISRYDRKDLEFPGTEDRSKEVTDLLFQILNQSPYERIGCQGTIDISTGGSVIRSHPWFASVDWVHVAAGVQNAPHVQQIRQKAAQVFDAAAPLVLEPYNGASSWFDGF
ncbi:AGC protein kinase [Saprolegnia parasitica CBS 223.65]|uniref:protein-serine/threonine phosphatase n=1 Tax=Saprolegnia parasitica (strain CBS 223.65) TaxID=695850 RepID=A0A067CQL9_SAPPC|nr:AGC protein kinase [Saprolegnia parasitica CBS 223.65]KDO32788.1 AGC protein kinase [Saprolegnia parasitica CBS 223.65]|eukprot:XP_012196655.1 AGC protein kinase [Saprolegnia parasitica CBS 223.65]